MGAVNRLQTVLTQLEIRLQAFFEGGADRLFPGIECAGLAQQLTAAMQAGIQIQPDGTIIAPNIYTLIVHPSHPCSLPENEGLLSSLADLLQRSAEGADLHFLTSPLVRVSTDPALAPQETQVLTAFRQAETRDTTAIPLRTVRGVPTDRLETPVDGRRVVSEAFLIVSGSQTVTIQPQGLTIGRREDLALVLDDPHVSRLHAQIRLVQGRYVIFDLESRAGTYVNGQRVTQYALRAGDVISLAGVQLVFGQEDSVSPADTQEITV